METLKDISIMEVAIMCELQFKGRVSHSGEQQVICPFRKDKTFYMNVDKGTWKCWRGCPDCPGHCGGGMLSLYGMCFNVSSNKEALKQIRQRQNGSSGNEYKKRQAAIIGKRKVESEVKYASIDEIDKAYRVLLDSLELKPDHLKNLQERGLDEQGIHDGLYKSLPESREEEQRVNECMNKAGITLSGVPGFYEKNGRYQVRYPIGYDNGQYVHGTGYFIPFFTQSGKIFSMQIRMDDKYLSTFPDPKERKRRRYIWLTSSGFHGGCQAINHASYGVDYKKVITSVSKTVYITEGALKANVAYTLSKRKRAFVAIAGIRNYKAFRRLIRVLKKTGCEKLVDAFDMDRYTNPNVMDAIRELYSIALEEGLPLEPFTWDQNYKGIDDFLLHKAKERGEV